MTNPAPPRVLIETPRLQLANYNSADDTHLDLLIDLYTSPESLAAMGDTGIRTRDKARALMEGFMADCGRRNGYGHYVVYLKPTESQSQSQDSTTREATDATLALGTPIGTISLIRGIPPNAYAVPDLGFIIHPAHLRKGYATEASRAAMDLARREYGVEGFLGLTDPKNVGAQAVFARLGFKNEGVRSARVFNGDETSVWTLGVALDEVGW